VTVLSAFIVTVQLLPDVLLQPVQLLKFALPDVDGAVSVMLVPEAIPVLL
jgi:hypothetical protein